MVSHISIIEMKSKALLFVLLFCSCQVQHVSQSGRIELYERQEQNPNILPLSLLLREQPQLYELFSLYDGVIGEWRKNNDTIFLFPKYEWYYRDHVISYKEVSSKDISYSTLPQKYIIKKDCFVDITDYSIVYGELPEVFTNMNYLSGDVFKRIKRY